MKKTKLQIDNENQLEAIAHLEHANIELQHMVSSLGGVIALQELELTQLRISQLQMAPMIKGLSNPPETAGEKTKQIGFRHD